MKKVSLFLMMCVNVFLLASCQNEDDIIIQDGNEKELYADYAFSLGVSTDEIEKQLQELDSMVIPIVAEYVSGTLPQTRAGEIIPYQGTITKKDNVKTVWKYGVGENLVPSVFCGNVWTDATISEIWEVALTIDLTNEDYAVRGFSGELSGWDGILFKNSQEKWQGQRGEENNVTFYTYIYKIVSDLSGRNYGYTDLYVPMKTEQARIYVRIYE